MTLTEQPKEESKTKDFRRKFDLKFGYQDKDEPTLLHKSVVINKRPSCGDYIGALERAGDSSLQLTLELVALSIAEFGKLTTPVPMTVLLSLNKIDRKFLVDEYNSFISETAISGGKIIEGGKVRLSKGFERDGKTIKDFEFGKLLTGYDEIEIEKQFSNSPKHTVLGIAKQLTNPSGVTLEELESLDSDDFLLLNEAEEKWLDSFR